MIIGIDIDSTLYHLDVIETANKITGQNYSSKKVKHWLYDKEINGFPKWFVDVLYTYFNDPDYMGSLTLNKGALERLLSWKQKGHEMHIISARSKPVRLATIRMLNKDFGIGFFDSINFVDSLTNEKVQIFKSLNIEKWIDDNSKDIYNAVKMGINTYAISNEYTKYNQSTINKILLDDMLKEYLNVIDGFCDSKLNNIGEIEL